MVRVGVKAGGTPRPRFSLPSQPWHDYVGAGPSGPFPVTASAEGAQFNVPPFPASATAEGRLVKGGPSPARGEGVKTSCSQGKIDN
jgi:hypothetical protein